MALGPFMRVGVVGCGRVGRTICFAVDRGAVQADLAAVCDTDAARAQAIVFQLKRPTRSMSLPGLAASVDLVIEATNRHSAPTVMMAALNAGKDLLVTNAAAIFARDDFARLAHDRGLTIYTANPLPTGGVQLNAAAAVPGATATLVLTCPPRVLAGAPFLRGRRLRVTHKPRLVFQGEAGDTLTAFPMLADLVAAAVVGAGPTQLLVRVFAGVEEEITDIELTLSIDKQQVTARSRVPAAEGDPVHPEVIGTLAVGVLNSLVSSLRLM